MSGLLLARAAGLLAASIILGSLVVSGLAGPSDEPLARGWRRRLGRTGVLLAVLLAAAAVVLGIEDGSGRAGLLVSVHAVAAGLWVGLLPPLSLLLRASSRERSEIPHGFARRAARRTLTLALGPLVVAAASALGLAGTAPGGLPALVGTRHGQLVLLQSILALLALALVTAAALSLRRGHVGMEAGLGRSGRRRLAAAIALGSASVLVAAALLGRPPGAAEPLVWPFPYRLAPGVTWEFPGVRDEVLVGAEILVGGLLALAAAFRIKGWRPLLVAAGIVLSGLGAYKALAALTLEAYPTTYARPAVAATPESIRRGRDLFASHCAVCHGLGGRGDGPAAAGLLQRPADLTASHTADHTPGDIFWWVTHGLGLTMPAFGDQLSVADRWDLVNFVRTLPRPLSPRARGRILGSGT